MFNMNNESHSFVENLFIRKVAKEALITSLYVLLIFAMTCLITGLFAPFFIPKARRIAHNVSKINNPDNFMRYELEKRQLTKKFYIMIAVWTIVSYAFCIFAYATSDYAP